MEEEKGKEMNQNKEVGDETRRLETERTRN